MCVVSVVMDYGQKTLLGGGQVTTPIPLGDPSWWQTPKINPQPANVPFDYEAYKAYAELLRKAAEYDKIMNEPNCHDPKKMAFLKSLVNRMNALGEEFRKISKDIQEVFHEEKF